MRLPDSDSQQTNHNGFRRAGAVEADDVQTARNFL